MRVQNSGRPVNSTNPINPANIANLRIYRSAFFPPASSLFPLDTPYHGVVPVPIEKKAAALKPVAATAGESTTGGSSSSVTGMWSIVRMPRWGTHSSLIPPNANPVVLRFERSRGNPDAQVFFWDDPLEQKLRTYGVAWTPWVNGVPRMDSVSLLPYRFAVESEPEKAAWFKVNFLNAMRTVRPGVGRCDYLGDWEPYHKGLAAAVAAAVWETREENGRAVWMRPETFDWPFVCVGSGL